MPTVTLARPVTAIIVEEDGEDDVIPGPPSRADSKHTNSLPIQRGQLDVSSTQHHKRGGGITASHKDLNLPKEEFAAGCNLLQVAARGDLEMVTSLLEEHPAHVNFRDYDRRTALHVAASEGHMHVCNFLIVKKKAQINRSDRWGGSPLDDAHRHRHQELVAFLRKHGATTGSADHITNLITAAAEGDIGEVRLLLLIRSGAHGDGTINSTHTTKNMKNVINEGDYDKRTALHLAAGEGHGDIVQLLCLSGANVNAEDRWGNRPLDDAFQQKNSECIKILESYGATPTQKKQNTEGALIRQTIEDNMQVAFSELEMIDRIGQGAFGEIYKCRWRGTLVAAKCIKSAKIRKNWLMEHALTNARAGSRSTGSAIYSLEDEEEMSSDAKDLALGDFRQETAILRSLRHPNICLLLAYSQTEDYEVILSELMKCSLLDVFRANAVQNRRMPKKTQLQYATQLAQGMNYLHTCKPPVIHRDLKPANLLIDHSGVIKVADFGLAKARPEPKPEDENPFVMTGETGSYRFMAPEVYRGEFYTETVDVYSYAMIFYYLLSGRPPWWTLGGPKAVAKAAEGERPKIPRDWDSRLSELLQQCWDENPMHRPSFSKIILRLNEYSRDVYKTNPDIVDMANKGCACVIS